MEDEQIIQLFFDRDEEAITGAQGKYKRLCTSIAKRILSDERDVDECVSDTWIRVWNSIPPQKPDSLGAYISCITRNLALDRYSYNHAEMRNTALTEAFEELEGVLYKPDDGFIQKEEAKDFSEFINAFLRKQSKDNRIIFVKRYWYGESVKEIADELEIGESKVKTSLFRTRNRLNEAMRKEGISIG